MKRYLGFLVLAGLAGLFCLTSVADVHGICRICGEWVVLTKDGFGLRRDWVGTCGRCTLKEALNAAAKEGEDPSETVDRMGDEARDGWCGPEDGRYVELGDGTIIDMRHFLAAADIGQDHNHAVAEVAMWLVEVAQWIVGQESGHPLGGNEDLTSNSAGALFADDDLVADGDPVGDQVVEYLESMGHGKIKGVSGSKGE
ncbi:MAG: hypothetical protein V2A76_13935 [Planctomycetota bacterium]